MNKRTLAGGLGAIILAILIFIIHLLAGSGSGITNQPNTANTADVIPQY